MCWDWKSKRWVHQWRWRSEAFKKWTDGFTRQDHPTVIQVHLHSTTWSKPPVFPYINLFSVWHIVHQHVSLENSKDRDVTGGFSCPMSCMVPGRKARLHATILKVVPSKNRKQPVPSPNANVIWKEDYNNLDLRLNINLQSLVLFKILNPKDMFLKKI